MPRLKCIDASNRPKEIPKKKWLTKGMEYTATWITVHPNQNNIQGVMLAEIFLDETCAPFETFKLSRFAIHKDDIDAFIKLAEECSGFSSDVIEEILEKEKLVNY
jgi:hypothetical protein